MEKKIQDELHLIQKGNVMYKLSSIAVCVFLSVILIGVSVAVGQQSPKMVPPGVTPKIILLDKKPVVPDTPILGGFDIIARCANRADVAKIWEVDRGQFVAYIGNAFFQLGKNSRNKVQLYIRLNKTTRVYSLFFDINDELHGNLACFITSGTEFKAVKKKSLAILTPDQKKEQERMIELDKIFKNYGTGKGQSF